MAEEETSGICVNLDPRKIIIENHGKPWTSAGGEELSKDTPFHICVIKKTLGYSDSRCASSTYHWGHGRETINYDEGRVAVRCPLYTTEEGRAVSARGALIFENLLREVSSEISSRFTFSFKNIAVEASNLEKMDVHGRERFLIDLSEKNPMFFAEE